MAEKSQRPDSYIGLSGVTEQSQQHLFERVHECLGLRDSRVLALGVKAVHKTQYLDIPNKYGEDWYPVGEVQFSRALTNEHAATTMGIAQAYLDVDYVGDEAYRDAFTNRIFERGSEWIDGIQFDMLPWHDNPDMLDFLTGLKQRHNTRILLQCHGNAMDTLGPVGAVRRLGRFAQVLDYVLFDSSHGTGKRLDTESLQNFLTEAYSSSRLEKVGFAIAGGLNGSVVREALPELIDKFPDLSWDAEGQLHPLRGDSTRPIDVALSTDYLRASAEAIG
jgi:hypothetical protein